MPSPICVNCQVVMVCQKNEQLVSDVVAGQFPASYWAGDFFECSVCDAAVVVVQVTVPPRTAAEQCLRGRNPDESITFAYSHEQRLQYADQFDKRSEAADAN